MRFAHLSDLHLGKKLKEHSLIEDQRYILNQIIDKMEDENPDGILIAGDIYDRSMPNEEAVELLNYFLEQLAEKNRQVFIISGNHDSAQRVAFGHTLFDKSGIHISPKYNGITEPYTMQDEFGKLNIYMLPFIRPADVRQAFPDEKIENYNDAVKVAIEKMGIDTSERNILIAHQFVTGSTLAGSEEIIVGGLDNVESSVFKDFDYVALGHIHGPQNIGGNNIRYCGTPLKYSFSEVDDKKSVTMIDFMQKGEKEIRLLELTPKTDMAEITGTYEGITSKDFYEGKKFKDYYLKVTLTDEEEIPNAMSQLRIIYPNIMAMGYDNTRTRNMLELSVDKEIKMKNPIEIFDEFYTMRNGKELSTEQKKIAEELIERIWGDN